MNASRAHRMTRPIARRLAAVLWFGFAFAAFSQATRAADTIVPVAYANTVSTGGLTTPLRSAARTYQIVIAANQLSGIPAGAPITGLAFRINPTVANGVAFPPSGVTAQWSDYTIQVSRSLNPPGALSTSFLANIGSDVVTARTGPLSLAPLSYAASPTPPAFGPVIAFTTSYIYTGGDIAITIRHSGNAQAVDSAADALPNSPPAPGFGSAIDAISANGASASLGARTFATVVQLRFTGPDPLAIATPASSPPSILAGHSTLLTVRITPATLPASTGITVTADLGQLGLTASESLFDDGPAGGHGDVTVGDNIFSLSVAAPASTCGNLVLPVTARDAQQRSATSSIALQVVAPLTWDLDAVPENEPDCGLTPNAGGTGVVDTVNGGCIAATPVFTPLPCGRKIAGTAGTVVINGTTFRDTDWYRIDLPQRSRVTWRVRAEFEALIGVIETGGSPNCPASNFRTGDVAIVSPCTEGVVVDCLPAGTWFLIVAPQFSPLIPCGRKYQAQAICGCTCPGDLNRDGKLDGADIQVLVNFLLTGGTNVGDCTDPNYCADANNDGAVTASDIATIIANMVSGTGCS